MEQTPDFVIFLGRFHPLLVHLPIGMLILAFVMEVLGRRDKFAMLKPATTFVLFWGALSAIAAAFLGWLLSQGGGYNEDTLFWHQWLGIFLAIFAMIAYLIKKYPTRMPTWSQKAFMPVLSLMMLMMIGAGHNGGSLTHGSDYLVQYAPQPIRNLAGVQSSSSSELPPITDVQKARVFEEIIHPIVKSRCQSCHNEDKKKGKLRLDTKEMFVKGGKGGAIFVAGNTDESELFTRITLPISDDDHMPPEGKKPLTKDQISLIEWWIASGAPFDKTVAEVDASPTVQSLLDDLASGDPNQQGIFALDIPAADADAIAQLNQRSARALPIAKDMYFLQVSTIRDSVPFGNEDMKLLLPLAEQITWLDLRNSMVDDYSLLAQLPHVTRLHLENTQIRDEDLTYISQLSHLEYLNLYGTSISNEGLTHLSKLLQLRAIYLWQTEVDSQGAKTLLSALPNLEINMGWDTLAVSSPNIPEE